MGSLHCPPSGIRLPSHPSRLRSEVEEQEVTVSTTESEKASEEEVKVEDLWIFFRSCIWINCPFSRLRVLVEGEVVVAAAYLEAKYGCAPGGTVVGREVSSGGVRCHCHIAFVWRSGGDEVI